MGSPAAPRRNGEGVLEIQKVPAAEQACSQVQRSKSETVEIAQWVGRLPGMQPDRVTEGHTPYVPSTQVG